MFKPLALTLTLASLFALPAGADTLGLKAHVSYWQPELSGHSRTTPALDFERDLGLSDEAQYSYSVALEHPVPLLPNVRVQRNDLQAGAQYGVLRSELDLSHTDATFYYEVLDNWLNLDIGVNYTDYDGAGLSLRAPGLRYQETSKSNSVGLYAHGAVELPFTGLSAHLELNGVGTDNGKVDSSISLAYEANSLVVAGGYRSISFKGDDFPDADFDGAFINLGLHF